MFHPLLSYGRPSQFRRSSKRLSHRELRRLRGALTSEVVARVGVSPSGGRGVPRGITFQRVISPGAEVRTPGKMTRRNANERVAESGQWTSLHVTRSPRFPGGESKLRDSFHCLHRQAPVEGA
jgi:hypothetical protein